MAMHQLHDFRALVALDDPGYLSRISRGLLASTVSVISVFSLGTVWGQEQPDEPSAILELPEVRIFGAARDQRQLLETPSAATIVTLEEMNRIQPSTYEDLLGDMPGVLIYGGPRGVSQEPNIRGFQDDQVVVRVDGARQNFNLTHRGRFFMDPAILKRVEVLRGGASTMFGSGALGGVISFETKDAKDVLDPGDTWGGDVRLAFNSQGSEFLRAFTGALRQGNMDMLAFFSQRLMQEDLKDGHQDPILDSDIDNLNGVLKLSWQPSNQEHNLSFGYQIYTDHGNTPNTTDSVSTPTTVANRNFRNQQFRLSWDYEPQNNDFLDLSALIYYNDINLEERRQFDGRLDTTDFTTVGGEVTNLSGFRLGDVPVTLAYGLEIFQDQQEASRNGQPRAQAPTARRSFYAGFAQADFAVLPKLTFSAGARYDGLSFDSQGLYPRRSESEFSPRLAVNYRPSDNTQLFASISQSFRAPSLTELYAQGTHFRVGGFPLCDRQQTDQAAQDFCSPGAPLFTGVNQFITTPNLKPERATQIEIGGRYQKRDVAREGDRLLISGNAYYALVDNHVDSVVQFVDFSTAQFNPQTRRLEVNGSTTNRNVNAFLYGFEGEVSYDAQRWFASANITLPHGKQRDGIGKLASIPQNRASLTLGMRPTPDWETGLRSTITGAINEEDVPPDALTTPAFATLDFFMNFQPGSGPFADAVFSLGIDNLTDERYRVHPNGLNSPGRAVKLGTTFTF